MADSIISAFRRRYPNDPRDDDQLALDIHSAYPTYSNQFPDFADTLKRITQRTQPQPNASPPEITPYPPSVGDYIKQAFGSGIRGVTSTLGSIPQAVASAAKIAGSYSVEGAENVPMYQEVEPGFLETAIPRFGEAISPEPVPGLEKSFLATTVPGAIGSGAGFIVGGAGLGLAERGLIKAIGDRALAKALTSGLAEAAAVDQAQAAMTSAATRLSYGNIASLGALSQAQQGYEEAKKAGGDEATRFLAFALNLPVGMTEAVPLSRMLNRMNSLSGGTLKHALFEAGVDSFEEAIQNSFQGVAGDVIAAKIAKYEPDRKLFSSLTEDAASGGISAAVLSLASSAIGGKLRAHEGAAPLGRPAAVTPAAGVPPPPAQPGAAAAIPSPVSPIVPPATGGSAAGIVPATPALVPAAPDVAAQYASDAERAAQRSAAIQDSARRSVLGGFGPDHISVAATLSPDEQIVYQQTIDRTRAEQAAIPSPPPAVPAAPAPVPAVTEVAPPPTAVAATPPVPQVAAITPAATAGPTGLPADLEAAAHVVAAPEGRLSKEQNDLLARTSAENPDLHRMFLDRVRDIRAATFPAASVPENVPPIAPAVPETVPATAASGIVQAARATALAIATKAKRTARKIVKPVEHPFFNTIDFEGDSPLTFEMSGRGVGERAARLAAIDPNEVVITDGEFKGQRGRIVRKAEGGGATIALPNATVLNVAKDSYKTLQAIQTEVANEDAARRGQGEAAVLAPAYFEVTQTLKPENQALQDAGLVSGRSPKGPVDHGSRLLWTHRWTVFRKGNQVTLLPTYKTESGRIVAAEAGKKAGTPVVDLMKRGLTPIASFRTETPQHALEAAKPVLGLAQYEKTLAAPARAQMAAMARTAAVVTAQMEPTRPTEPGEAIDVRGRQRTLVTQAGEEGTVAGLEPSTVPLTQSVKFSAQLSNDLYPVLTAALAMEPGKQLSTSTEATQSALVNYVANGKHRSEIIDLAYELSESIGRGNAVDAIFARVVGAYNNARSSAEFAEALSRAVASGDAIGGVAGQPAGVGGGVQRAGIGGAAVAPSENRGVAGAVKGTAGPAGPQRSQPKFRIADGGYYVANAVRAKLQAVLDRLAIAGVDVSVLEARLEEQRIISAQRGNAIVLSVRDIANPSTEDLITAIHETVHWLADQESPEMRERLHRAVDMLSAAQLGLSPVISARLSDPRIDPETRASERLAYSLESQGVDAIAARGWGQRIIRALKDLWFRASMAIQTSLFGPDAVNPERVFAYFKNRMESFLAGDQHPISFVNFMGGGHPSIQRQVRYFTPVTDGGSGWEPVLLDWENGRMQHGLYLPTTADAARFNLLNAARESGWKFRDITYVTEGEQIGGENPTVRAGWMYATAKGMQGFLQRAYDAFNASGRNTSATGGTVLSPRDFAGIFQGKDLDHPDDVIADVNQQVDALGAPPVNPDLSIDGPVTFHNDATRQQARAMLLGTAKKWFTNITRVFQDETSRRQSLIREAQQKIAKQDRLAQKYQDLTVTLDAAKETMRGLIDQTKADIRSFVRDAKTIGMLTQAIKEFQANVNDPVPLAYENLIDKVSDRLLHDAPHFTQLLQDAAALDINWHGQTMLQIKAQLRPVLETNPLFQGIPEDERNLALSLIGAFARTNDHYMAWLAVRASNDYEARDAIRVMLNEARKGTTADLNRAKGMVESVPRKAAQAQRILTAYTQAMADAASVVAEQYRNGKVLDAYAAAAPVFQQAINDLERPLTARALYSPAVVEGAELPYVFSDTDTVQQIEAAPRFVLHTTGDQRRTPAEIQELYKRYDAWIARNEATGGALVETLRDLSTRLKAIDAVKQQVAIKQSLLGRTVGTMADAMRETGTITGARIANMMTNYSTLSGAHERGPRGLETYGFRAEAAKDKAMRALRIKDNATFDELFHQQGKGYFEKRKDLQERPDAHEAALGALHQYFLSNPAIRPSLTPAAWDKLRAYYEANVDYSRAMARINKEMGNRVMDDNLGLYRDVIGDPLFTFQRGVSEHIERAFHKMRDQWNGTKTQRLAAGDVAERFSTDPAALAAAIGPRFSDDVWRNFVGGMSRRQGRAMFSGRMYAPGKWTIASVENVERAYRESSAVADPGARVLEFSMRLHAFEGNTPDALPAHVGETLATMQNYFNGLEKIFGKTEDLKDRFGINVGVPRFLMDGRISEDFPTEWLKYPRFDQNHARSAVHRMAFHAAYGRDGAAVATEFNAARAELDTAIRDWAEYLRRVGVDNLLAHGKQKLELARELAKKEGRTDKDISLMEKAELNRKVVDSTEGHFEAWSKTYSSDLVEAKAFLEGLSLMTGMMVQGIKTAVINTQDLAGGPFIQYGPSTQAIRMVRDNWAGFINSAAGSLLNTIGFDFKRNADDMLLLNRLGYGDQDNSIVRMDHLLAAANAEIPGGPIASRLIRAGRFTRALTQIGIPQQGGVYTTIKAAPFSVISRWMNEGFILANWKSARGLIARAVNFYRSNPTTIDDPTFRFSANDLGYTKGPLLDDERAFVAIKEAMARWGMSLENMAKEALHPGAPIISDANYRALAQMALEEQSLESSPTTAPRWGGNPVGRFTMPLLRWSFARTNQLRKSFNEPGGQASLRAMANGLKAFSLITGVGIAYALLMDRYDEELLGKKSNIRGFGQDNNFLAAIEMTARMGGWGLWGDLANTVGNLGGSGDLRGMSLDNRVVFMNSLLNMLSSVTTLAKQGDATYDTVYRQLLQAMGGSGYLQEAQIINHLLSLDNAEARTTARINVSNILRAVGREMNLDVRVGRGAGAYAQPTAESAYIGQMILAAMASDQGDFLQAYSKAIAAAREDGKPDPQKYVQQAYAARNPLRTVYVTPPTEAEYRQILSRLPDSQRQAVQSAVLLFNRYGDFIGSPEYEGKKEKFAPPKLTMPAPRGVSPLAARGYAAATYR